MARRTRDPFPAVCLACDYLTCSQYILLCTYLHLPGMYVCHHSGMPRAPAQRSHPATTVAGTASITIRPVLRRIRLRCLTGCAHWYNVAVLHAGVAELVDAPDSKSGAPKGACRFEPDLRYSLNPCKQCLFCTDGREPLVVASRGFGSSAAAVDYERASSIALAALSCMLGSTCE